MSATVALPQVLELAGRLSPVDRQRLRLALDEDTSDATGLATRGSRQPLRRLNLHIGSSGNTGLVTRDEMYSDDGR